MGHPLARIEKARHAGSCAEPEGIARCQHDHAAPPMFQQPGYSVSKGHWPFDCRAGNRGQQQEVGAPGLGVAAALRIELKYFDGEPVIREISRVSKPGRRVYVAVRNLPRINNGLGVAILSTPKGVMADHEARSQNLGGEVLCRVF